MDAKKLFLKYQRRKEKYIQRLERVLDEELAPKETLSIAKGCSDIMDSVISMAKDLGLISAFTPAEDLTMDALSDDELWRYLESSKKAIPAGPLGDVEAESEN